MTNQVIDHQLLYRPYPQLKLFGSEQPSLLESLRNNLRDVFFPEKHAPLRLTSRPVAVRSIWEQRRYGRSSVLSLMVHGVAGALLLVAAIASITPALRIARLNPADTLRE